MSEVLISIAFICTFAKFEKQPIILVIIMTIILIIFRMSYGTFSNSEGPEGGCHMIFYFNLLTNHT